MDFDNLIKSRHSVRKFNSKEPRWEEIVECIDAARFTPMAGNNYTLKFITVNDSEKINKIGDACQQDFVKTAKYIVVVCSDPSRTTNAYGEKGKNYVRQQAGAGIQNFWLKLTEKKLATCWVGYFIDYQIKEVLEIPEKIEIEAIFPIGYEYKIEKTKKPKIDLANIIYFNNYGNQKINKQKKFTA